MVFLFNSAAKAAHDCILDATKSDDERIAACLAFDKAMGLKPEDTGEVDWHSVVEYCESFGVCAKCGEHNCEGDCG